jgi:hypothetical protein
LLYDYVAKIKGLKLPLVALIYEGYVPYGLYAVAKGKAYAVMRKALDVPSDLYYVEFPVGGVSIFASLKYSRYAREDMRAGAILACSTSPRTWRSSSECGASSSRALRRATCA